MGHIPVVGPVAAAEGLALKPRESSSTGAARAAAAAEEEVAAQSAKAPPESEVNLLVVATTENSFFRFFNISLKSQNTQNQNNNKILFLLLLWLVQPGLVLWMKMMKMDVVYIYCDQVVEVESGNLLCVYMCVLCLGVSNAGVIRVGSLSATISED